MYKKDHGDNKAVEFLICYHCRSDNEAREYFEKTFPGKKLLWKAFCALKDADSLDRVRFPFGSEDYLDVESLRINRSKELVPVAHQLNNIEAEDV